MDETPSGAQGSVQTKANPGDNPTKVAAPTNHSPKQLDLAFPAPVETAVASEKAPPAATIAEKTIIGGKTTVTEKPRSVPSSGGWWTIPIMCMGIAIIAAAMIVGQVEENRQLAWQRNKLEVDAEHLRRQVEVNREFLARLDHDPELIERLAQRQMKLVREGSALLNLPGNNSLEMQTPFTLVRVPPPPEVKPYEPSKGKLMDLLGTPRQRIHATGFGAFLVAVGLIMGRGKPENPRQQQPML